MHITASYAEEETGARIAGDAFGHFSLVYRLDSVLGRSEKGKIKTWTRQEKRKCHSYRAFVWRQNWSLENRRVTAESAGLSLIMWYRKLSDTSEC